jgi:hypothetical protein
MIAAGDPGPAVSEIFSNLKSDRRPLAGGVLVMSRRLARRRLAPGQYDLFVYARSAVAGSFNQMRSVRVTVN